jgi:2-polyprenyl-3-methyl-5-hydroxy-6-metoxy-1,4-benzoquinol methylase
VCNNKKLLFFAEHRKKKIRSLFQTIMTVKEHYENHLSSFYSWMTGDFLTRCNEFKKLLTDNAIVPFSNTIAVDLGAAHGIQSIPLAELGFKVIAVDFNQHLLNELQANAKGLDITTVNDDIKNVATFSYQPELIVCCGDTLSHLDNKAAIKSFIANIAHSLTQNGKVIFSFRDYSTALKGTARFIPLKSDDHKILTCILDYEEEFVTVTDLVHEKTDTVWQQKVSSYKKVRLLPDEIVDHLKNNGLTILYHQPVNRLTTIIACKQ